LIDTHRELFGQVKGFLDDSEGEALYAIAQEAGKTGPCLEIGSYCGKSTLCIGAACKETGNILFTIDHHRGSEEQQPGEEYFDSDLFNYQTFQVDTFTTFRETLLFIDGGHAVETVRLDFESWAHHVLPGGYLVFHDIFTNPEEGGQAPYDVYQSAVSSGQFIEEPMIKTLGILRRKS